MTLMSKEKPGDICEHLKELIEVMIKYDMYMSHDFEGSFIFCGLCDSEISLEAYDRKFTQEDIED